MYRLYIELLTFILMALSVRKKIWLGTTFFFILLILTGGVSIYHTVHLKNESRAILEDNYESLAYCHAMQRQLDSMELRYNVSLVKFGDLLQRQEANVTEPGERASTKALRQYFTRFYQGDSTEENIGRIKRVLHHIVSLNMEAISIKNQRAIRTSDTALGFIIALASVVFLIAFTFWINFPTIITTPINSFMEAIGEISNGNYRHRIYLDNKDEFGNLANAFNQMAERLEYFESSNLNKILFEKGRAEAVINSLNNASIGVDGNDRILFANYQALQLLHLNSIDIVGKTVEDVCQYNDLFRFLVRDATAIPFKIAVAGREHYFTKQVIEVAQGKTGSRVIVLNDITSFKEQDVAKTHFIATISHELKTPLAASDLSLKLLEDERTGYLSPEQQELVRHLKQDNLRMLKILSELLNMSQAETGRMQLHMQRVYPMDIIDNAISTVAASAREKHVMIDRTGVEHLPYIHADAEKTTWVLNNFLTNAIKYAPDNSIVKISVWSNGDHIVFAVGDSGPGIPEVYQARLFERYFQVPGSGVKGTGIGLAISKDFIEAQGGSIWVETEEGRGAVFYFSLIRAQ